MSRHRTRAANGLHLASMVVAVWLLISGAGRATAGTPTPAISASTQAESIDYRSAPKFAVVIGNTRYPGRYALHNAESDARLVAARLKQAGYARARSHKCGGINLVQCGYTIGDGLVVNGYERSANNPAQRVADEVNLSWVQVWNCVAVKINGGN